jgi:hypothetical protein
VSHTFYIKRTFVICQEDVVSFKVVVSFVLFFGREGVCGIAAAYIFGKVIFLYLNNLVILLYTM